MIQISLANNIISYRKIILLFLSHWIELSYQSDKFQILFAMKNKTQNNIDKDQISQNSQNKNNKFSHNVQVKGKYLGGKQSRILQIDPLLNKIYLYQDNSEKRKEFDLDKTNYKQEGKSILIETQNGRKYQIQTDKANEIAHNIQSSKKYIQINKFSEQPIHFIPKHINYMTPAQYGLTNQIQKILHPTQDKTSLHTDSVVKHKIYPRRHYFWNPADWIKDLQRGGFLFINQEKTKNQTKIVKFVIKKFLSTGSFMGISFPVLAMKPQTILQTYAKVVGMAPILLQNLKNSVQRMKKFICFIMACSVLFCDLDKPFNPVIGQTFQATIAGGNFSAQQISHHPPISAFFYEGNGYKVYGSMEMSACIGVNSATGLFIGDLKVKFDDGNEFKGRLPAGQMSGIMFGDRTFQTSKPIYAYDNKRLVFSGTTLKKNNYFEGFIGKLKPKYEQDFLKQVKSQNRFQKFPFYESKCFDTIFSCMESIYNQKISFDGKQYFNFDQHKYLSYEPEQIENSNLLLKSDSRFRKDIPLLKHRNIDDAQIQKQKLEEEQRTFRKLRQKYGPKK